MTRYIDANEAVKTARKNKAIGQAVGDIVDFQQIIDDTPTADVVEVVRCKDCVLHNSCIPEETFNFSGIENPFCCVGKKVQNDL